MSSKISKIKTGRKGKRTTGVIIRTTHRSRGGIKLYAVRDSKGRFKDIQTYKRAHALDIKRGGKTNNTGPRIKR